MNNANIFKCKDKVIIQYRNQPLETFINKVVTSEYIDADGQTVTTKRIYYADATGGLPVLGDIVPLHASDNSLKTKS